MEGLFGDDPSGPDPGGGANGDSPDSESGTGTGPLVDVGGNSPSRGSLSGSTATKYLVNPSFSQSVDGVNEDDRMSMSSAAMAGRYRSNENFNPHSGAIIRYICIYYLYRDFYEKNVDSSKK